MATGAGRPRAGCRAARAIGAASRRCAAPCAPPAISASSILTIFSFSSENWSRPPAEIRELMGLLRRFIRNDLAELHRSNVRVRIIGERDGLDPDIAGCSQEAEDLTRDNTGLTAGRRLQLRRAAGDRARGAARRRRGRGRPLAPADDHRRHSSAGYLDAPDLPDPDLIIRTSGEQRLSNFLLWQAAYSELVFVPTYWPDFDRATLEEAIAEYRRRERRFGGLVARDRIVTPWRGAGSAQADPRSAVGTRANCAARRLGAGAGAARDRRSPISAAGRSRCSGPRRRSVILWEWTRWSPATRSSRSRLPASRWSPPLRPPWSDSAAWRSVALAVRSSRSRRCACAAARLDRGRRALCGRAGARADAAARGCAVRLRRDVFLFAVVWATDILAYFVGRAVGGPKLVAARQPEEDLVGRDRRGARRRRRPGLRVRRAGGYAIVGSACDRVRCCRVGVAGGDLFESGDQAPVRRQGCEPPHPRPWRLDGSPRRFRCRGRRGGVDRYRARRPRMAPARGLLVW